MHQLTVGVLFLVVAVVSTHPVSVWAAPPRPILCESHAGARPLRSDAYIGAVREGLGAPAPLSGPQLDALIVEHVSRPTGTPDFPLLRLVREAVSAAREAAVQARFGDTVTGMERLRLLVAEHPAAVAADPRIRRSLLDGYVTMLKALNRLHRQDQAESLAAEIVRSYPDLDVSAAAHGPETAGFYERLRRHFARRAQFTIGIETTPAGAAVFVNERYVGTSPLRVGDLTAGTYRVMARSGSVQSRLHRVIVLDGSVDLRVDLAFDQALGPAGFHFADEAARARQEAGYALRLARALGASAVITTGLTGPSERPLWGAVAYNGESGGVLRSAAVALAPVAPPHTLLVSLGRFLRAGEPAEGIIVRQEERGLPSPRTGEAPEARPRSLRMWSYAGLAAGLALVGVGGYLLHVDGQCAEALAAGQLECPRHRQSFAEGATSIGVGAAVLLGAATLLYLDLRRSRVRAGVTVGAGAAPTFVWVGGTL